MKILVIFAFLFILTLAQDANDCLSIPTCKECIAHNLCGWCGVNVVYDDGTLGPHCAGKPSDPSNPPPGWKPWTCPKDFQNTRCYGYLCNNSTYQCVSAGPAGAGVPLEDCINSCFPPTYECNKTTTQCFKVPPGRGTDLPDCQMQCQATSTTGTTGTTGTPSPTPYGYLCDPNTITCKMVSSGGLPFDQCMINCHNNTPDFVIGNYRGLEIDSKFVKGEWQAKITQESIVIIDPTGKPWTKGVVRQNANELWLVTLDGTRRGIFGIQETPEVSVLTWAMGEFGQTAPANFDAGLKFGTTFVFVKCLNSNICKWHLFQALNRIKLFQEKWLEKQLKRVFNPILDDPCSKYPDCHSCITAPEWCGWCSVPILYNNTIVGKNCAGLNTSVTPRINCTGTFSTQDCSQTTTTSTGKTTGGPSQQYYCDPLTSMCVQSVDGTLPLDTCNLQCIVTPVVPAILQDKYFRGLEIDMSYLQGEWRVHFTKTDVTVVSPDGTVLQGNVTTTGQYLTIHLPGGVKIQTIWQFHPGPAVDNLSWAWGVKNRRPPTSFDESMIANGEKEFWMVTCHPGADQGTCDFSK